ncbi:MAG TPA: hypothetical protein VLG47_04525 [Candidatus Saccharimonadales bacterium]|nr:hypothetical protein [Candidatus Saccharimonadales bacterium]
MPTTKRKNSASKVKRPSTRSNNYGGVKKRTRIQKPSWLVRWWPAIVFVILIGGIGAYFLLHSSAATSPPVQLKMIVNSTHTNLCLDDSSTSSNVISYPCDSSDKYQQWVLVGSGSGFMIKNPNTGHCVNDPGAGVGINPSSRVYITTHACDGSTGVVWNWTNSMLYNVKSIITWNGTGKTTTTHGCINDPASTLSRSQMIVYPCDGPGKTYWDENEIASSGGGGGGSTCPTYTNPPHGTSDTSSAALDAEAKARTEAKCLMSQWGWSPSAQWDSLNALWEHESNWRYWVHNGQGSGACGIPQFLPCQPKYSANSCTNFINNVTCQIKQGFEYIKDVYGTPSAAWLFWQNHNPHYYIEYRDPSTGAVTRN